jgi:diacylglycerol O-acyltransferase / wax synthase
MTPTQRSSEPLSSVDAVWFNMDSPTNLAIITGILTFPEPIDLDRLRRTIESRLLPYNRFRQRVQKPKSPLGRPYWEIDPDFDMDYHVLVSRLPDPGDHNQLQQLVSEIQSIPLDRSKPLWRIIYLDNYQNGSALVCRLHHCIADGIAFMQVLLSMTDDDPDASWPDLFEEPTERRKTRCKIFSPIVTATNVIGSTVQTTGYLVHEGMDILIHPTRMLDTTRLGISASRALSKLLLIPPDRKTLFKQECGIEKRAAWSVALNLDEVKAVGWKMGATINDILISATTGALGRYLEERGEPVSGVNIRALVPINLRPPDELDELGNRFGLVFLSLPIGIKDQVRRQVVLKRRMDAIKNSPEAVVATGILNFIGMTPRKIEKIIISIFGMKGTAVITNVPGPRQLLYLAGIPISTVIFWVPAPSSLSIGVSILSYNGNIMLGVATDAAIIPDPEHIIELFQQEFETMKQWGQPAGSRPTINRE